METPNLYSAVSVENKCLGIFFVLTLLISHNLHGQYPYPVPSYSIDSIKISPDSPTDNDEITRTIFITLPDYCFKVDLLYSKSGNSIDLFLTIRPLDPGEVCIQIIGPATFTESVTLGILNEGEYKTNLYVNDSYIRSTPFFVAHFLNSPSFWLEPDSQTAVKENQCDIRLKVKWPIEIGTGLGNFSGEITWNPSVISYESTINLHSFFTGFIINPDTSEGVLAFSVTGPGQNCPTGEMDLFQVNFKAIGSEEDTTNLGLNLTTISRCDFSDYSVSAMFAGSVVSISTADGEVPCDFNNDNKLDIADVIALLLLLRSNPGDLKTDFNRDGESSIADAVALLLAIRDGTCLDASVKLSGANNKEFVKKMSELSIDEINYLKRFLQLLNLTEEEERAVNVALYGQSIEPLLPKSYRLNQNSPNPFNPSTTIYYNVPDNNSSEITIKIYDLRGKLVRTLVDKVIVRGGAYSVLWEGTNEAGNQVSSGVYLCRMTADGFYQTRKMILLK